MNAERRQVLQAGGEEAAVYMNCSGKHAAPAAGGGRRSIARRVRQWTTIFPVFWGKIASL
ncbi:asparaginase [Streptosporangium soli]|nr:asparaginase [Streptosporangium sp. KLBMP 9127]